MTKKPLDIFIGLGAAKSGSTWLHDYLTGHPQAHLKTHKEIYYFGRQTPGVKESVRRRNTGITQGVMNSFRVRGLLRHQFEVLRDMQEWHDYLTVPDNTDKLYPDYLRLRSELTPDARICGDITPQYAMMSMNEFKQMDATVPDARYVFLLREPVSRWWSHCNHIKRQDVNRDARAGEGKQVVGSVAQMTTAEIAQGYLSQDKGIVNRIKGHSDYKETLEKLLSFVPKERLFIGFHEDLTHDTQVREMCSFLGLDFVPANQEKRVNVGDKVEIPADIHRAAVDVFRSEYEAVCDISQRALPDLWHSVYAAP